MALSVAGEVVVEVTRLECRRAAVEGEEVEVLSQVSGRVWCEGLDEVSKEEAVVLGAAGVSWDGEREGSADWGGSSLRIRPLALCDATMQRLVKARVTVEVESSGEALSSECRLGTATTRLGAFFLVNSSTDETRFIRVPVRVDGLVEEAWVTVEVRLNDDFVDFLHGSRVAAVTAAAAKQTPLPWWQGDEADALSLEVAFPFPGAVVSAQAVPTPNGSEDAVEDDGEDADAARIRPPPTRDVDWSHEFPAYVYVSAATRREIVDAGTFDVVVTVRRGDDELARRTLAFAALLETSSRVRHRAEAGIEYLPPAKEEEEEKGEGGDQEDAPASIPPQVCTLATSLDVGVSLNEDGGESASKLEMSQVVGDVDVIAPRISTGSSTSQVMEALDTMVTALTKEMAQIVLTKDPVEHGDSVDAADERRWLFGLNETGLYHHLKEQLKPSIQRLVRKHQPLLVKKESTTPGHFLSDDGSADRFLAEAYCELSAVANRVLDRRFADAESSLEPQPDAFAVDGQGHDDSESPILADLKQRLDKLDRLADDRAAADDLAGALALDRDAVDAVENVLRPGRTDVDDDDRRDATRVLATARLASAGRVLALAGRGCRDRDAAVAAAERAVRDAVALLDKLPRDLRGKSLVLFGALLLEGGEPNLEAARLVLRRACECDDPDDSGAVSRKTAERLDAVRLGLVGRPVDARLRLDVRDPWDRVRVLLDTADWVLCRGLAKTGRVLLDAAKAAERRCRTLAEISADPKLAIAPRKVRASFLRAEARIGVIELADTDVLPEIREVTSLRAQANASKAAVLDPEHPDAWLTLGLAKDRGGSKLGWSSREQRASAEKAYSRGLAVLRHRLDDVPPLWLYRRLVALRFDAGRAFWTGGERDLTGEKKTALVPARAVAVEACRRWPNSAACWRDAGAVFLELGRPDRAEDALEEANVLDKDDAKVWGLLVVANLAQYTLGDPQRVDQAATVLQHALTLGLDDPGLLRRAGVAFAKVDRHDLALDLLRRAADFSDRDMDLRDAMLDLGRVYAANGRLDDAAIQLAAALQLHRQPHLSSSFDPGQADAVQADLDAVLSKLGRTIAAA